MANTTIPALIIDNTSQQDGYVLVTHADYFLSFNVHGVLNHALQDINDNKYKHITILKLNNNEQVYNTLIEKYQICRPTSITFTNYYGKNSVDFLPLTIKEVQELVK